ncbi:MAG: hypothetical protein WBA20_20940 [Ketobacter sp.]
MGSIIRKTAVVENKNFSAIENTATAGIKCIEASGIDPSRIGVLIYAGLYRDDNIMEPSVASLVQKKIQIGLDISASNLAGMTFSFDVINGANSVMSAISVADSILQNDHKQFVLIVAGDAHPSKSDHKEFPFEAVGAAMLLGWDTDSLRGFHAVSYLSDHTNAESSFSATGKLEEFGMEGRSHVRFESDPHLSESYLHLNAENINQYLQRQRPKAIDFILSSEPVRGFSQQLVTMIDFQHPADGGVALSPQSIDLHGHFGGDIHTAAPIAAFDVLIPELKDRKKTTLLFSTVGSGNASACALYCV